MLPRSRRLSSAQFDRAFANSQSVRHPLVALKAHQRGDDVGENSGEVRAAFVVPKKQAKAVGRNRTRRRLRECYRLHPRRDDLTGCDLIFLSTPATHGASIEELNRALDEVLRRMKRKLDGSASFSATERTENAQRNSGESKEFLDSDGKMEIALSSAFSVAETKGGSISVFATAALSVIRFYQRFISPGLPPSCRFYPSCSRYTYGAIERFGLARGLWLGTHRVCRCHPWNAGGIDEVPAQFPSLTSIKTRATEKIKAFYARRHFDSPRN